MRELPWNDQLEINHRRIRRQGIRIGILYGVTLTVIAWLLVDFAVQSWR